MVMRAMSRTRSVLQLEEEANDSGIENTGKFHRFRMFDLPFLRGHAASDLFPRAIRDFQGFRRSESSHHIEVRFL